MANLEELLLSAIDLKPYIWSTYIDDIFLIWEHGEESLKLFLEKINSIHPTIKFTADWSYCLVNFLNVKVKWKDGKIITNLHVKPTDSILTFFIMLPISLQKNYPLHPSSAP